MRQFIRRWSSGPFLSKRKEMPLTICLGYVYEMSLNSWTISYLNIAVLLCLTPSCVTVEKRARQEVILSKDVLRVFIIVTDCFHVEFIC